MTDDDRGLVDPERLGARLGAHNEQEAREFEEVAAQLAAAAEPVQPPAELKAALFAKLDSTPQLPADTVQEASDRPQKPAPAPAEHVPAEHVPQLPAERQTSAERRADRRWFQRPAVILAAAAAAVILFVAGTFFGVGLAGTDTYQHEQATALAAINAAPDAQRASSAVSGGGTATLVWSAQLGRSAVIATDLPKLADDKTYELWYIKDGAATPAGTMDSSGTAASWRVLDGAMTAGVTVGMTVEPDGGSPKPTTQPILAITPT
ncbi:anti-sigma factor [Leifsonia shinshuensis]|uniref:anti-sigma factor n=1 Tax=Leifsonia shinshuensis TaxID=150026 RepID=UPI001F511C6C|nr:anti-sigma factor [Leifsonia shinshuensis]MCI0156382.1 anti-sigma factor [Leifsonia shinshuensis]